MWWLVFPGTHEISNNDVGEIVTHEDEEQM
jgi:hypothetical protein